jgi:hypothetical protein
VFYFFLVIVGALGVGVYVLFILRLVPGAAEERFGVLEPLPNDVGKWKLDDSSPAGQAAASAGQHREERLFYEERTGLLGSGKLVRQVRYRNVHTNAIERIEPDQIVKRKRVKV